MAGAPHLRSLDAYGCPCDAQGWAALGAPILRRNSAECV